MEFNKTIKAAVIGDPIAHSLSPKLHNYLLETQGIKHGVKGSYEAILTKENELEDKIKWMIGQGYVGFNVTLPHKESVRKICNNNLTINAKIIGAVNTVQIGFNNNPNEIWGDNTDAAGFIKNLLHYFPTFSPANKTAFVMGAGGAARAVLHALNLQNIKKIVITNRSEDRVRTLIEELNEFNTAYKVELVFMNYDEFEDNLNQCDLLVNTTSLGMINTAPLNISLKKLSKDAIVYDIVYKPLMTELLINAQKNGNRIVTGIGMLIFQALVGHEIWFGYKPQVTKELFDFMIKESQK